MAIREKLNLKTNQELKPGQIQKLSNEQLLALNRSARRSQASAATGVVGGGLISLGNPAFLGGAAVSGWQGTVASINKHRIKEEIERRKARDPTMQQLIDANDKPVQDVMVGVAFKTVVGGVTLGIAGADTAFDNALALATDSSAHVVAAAAADPSVASGLAPDVSHAGNAASATTDVPHPHADEFEQEHPDGFQADHAAHGLTNGIGDSVAEGINNVTGHHITTDSSWLHLDNLHDVQGVGGAALATETAIVGAQAELTQIPQMAAEVALDDKLKRRHQQQAEAYTQSRREEKAPWEQQEKPCPHCTFANRSDASTCRLCGGKLLASSLPGAWPSYPYL